MKRNFCGLICLCIGMVTPRAFAQFLDPPFAGQIITTDFGPRVPPTYGATWFHAGIDYNPAAGDADAGYDIPAIEPAVITAIGLQGSAGWVVNFFSTENPNRAWSYLHTFENVADVPSELGRFELGKTADGVYFAIRFTDTSRTTIDKAFINDTNSGRLVTSQSGESLRAYSDADYGEAIAPLGVSGIGTGAHLHLNFNYSADNPFEVVFHPPDLLPVATILMPENGEVIPESELDGYVFMAEVHSESGLDLDKVSFWIYPNGDSSQAIHLGTPGLPTFGYGGRGGEAPNGFPFYSSFGGATGVQPVSLGHDNFIFRQNLTTLNLPDGQHKFVVKMKDVNDNSSVEKIVDFTIDDYRPFVQNIVVGGASGYKSEWVKGATSYTRSVVPNPVYGSNITVDITFSEPVKSPVLVIDAFGPNIALSPSPEGQQKIFRGAIAPAWVLPSPQEGLRSMRIEARDMADNTLLALGPNDTSLDIATQLIRGVPEIIPSGPDTSAKFMLDNFRPYLEYVEVKNSGGETKYLHAWNFNGNILEKVGPAPNEIFGAGTYTMNFRFSEPVVSPALSIDTLKPVLGNPSGDQKSFATTVSWGEKSSIQSGVRSMTVKGAKDLAGNDLLLLPAEKTIIDPSSELTRNDSGIMQGPAGSELVNFKIDRTPPSVMLAGHPDGLRGVLTKEIPLSAGTHTVMLNDAPKTLCDVTPGVCDAVANVKSYKIVRENVDVFGPVTLDPPLKKQPVSFNLPSGSYVLEVRDAVDNPTRIPFRVLGFSLEVSIAGSHVDIKRDAGTFDGTLHLTAKSDIGLETIALLDKELRSFGGITFSGTPVVTSSETDIGFGGNIADYYYKPNQFALWFTDNAGRLVWQPLNLDFGRQHSYFNHVPGGGGRTTDFSTPVIDLVQTNEAMLPGAVMSLYAPTRAQVLENPQWWWWDGRNGFYGAEPYPPCLEQGQDCTTHRSLPYSASARQDAGNVKVVTETWDKPDRSDMVPYPDPTIDRDIFVGDPRYHQCGNQLGYEEFYGMGCYADRSPTNTTIELKRYVQTFVTITKTAPTAVTLEQCAHIDTTSGQCTAFYDFTPSVFAAGPYIHGIRSGMGAVYDTLGAMLPAGSNIRAQLIDGISVYFGLHTVLTPGILRFSYASVDDYPGFKNLSGNLAFRLKTEATFDHASLTIPYDAAGLTPEQETAIKVYKITDDGEYITLGTVVDTVNKKVQSSEMDSFGRFLVAAPRYTDPRTATSIAYAGGRPELEFTAEGVLVEQNVFDAGTPEGAVLLSSIAQNGLLVGNIYEIGPQDLVLADPGTLKMHFDAAVVEAAGIKSMAICRADADGTGLSKLSEAILDPVNHEIAVDVWQPAGLYMLIGSTTAKDSDKIPPTVAISYGEPKHTQTDKLYISTRTTVSMSGTDAGPAGSLISGMGAVYYLVDASPILETSWPYSGPFTVKEGIRTLYYSAADQAGNMSAVSSATVYVDGTPPVVDLLTENMRYANGGSADITEGSTIALSAIDPEGNGAASGLGAVLYFIDVSPEECRAGGDVPAACQNPVYNGPFSLSVGTHTVYYSAVDNVGNQAEVKTAYITVASPDTTPPVTEFGVVGSSAIVGGKLYLNATSKVSLSAHDPAPVDSAGLLAYWTFDETEGTTAYDAVGTNNATLVNGPVRNSAGVVGGALQFDGINDYVNAGNNLDLSAGAVTLAGWIYPTALYGTGLTADKTIMSAFDSNGNRGYILLIRNGFLVYNSQDAGVGLGGAVSLDQWQHVAVTVTGVVDGTSDYTLYLNGAIVGSGNKPSFVAVQPTAIGAYQPHTYGVSYFKGSMDELAIYNRVLSASEIAGLYGKGSAGLSVNAAGSPPSGVAFTEYSIDAAPYQSYSAPFGFVEGMRTVEYRSRDNAGNLEVARSTVVYVDGTAPNIDLAVNGSVIVNGAAAQITDLDLVTLAGADPMVNGVASGLKSVNYAIDAEFTAGNIGTYAAPFMLGLGTHTVYYTAGDNAGNQASVKTAYLTVVSSDSTPPVTDFNVAGISADVDGKLYMSAGSSVSLVAYDPAPAPTGMLAYWDFEEGGGNTAIDVIGGGHNGAWAGSGAHYGAGRIGSYAAQFNGTDDVLSVPSGNLNPGTGEYTVSFWANPRTYSIQWTPFITKWSGNPGEKYFYTYLTNDGHTYNLFADWNTGLTDDLYSNSVVPLNAWTHITVTRDASAEKIYINGVLDASRAATTIDATNLFPLLIGSRLGSGPGIPNFDGLMDGVGIYKHALSAEEVRQQYEEGLAGRGPAIAGSASGWAFTEYSIDSSPFQVYLEPFNLSEGVRTIAYRSQDNAGNLEVARSTVVYVDGTAPNIDLAVNGSVIANGAAAQITDLDQVVLAGADPVVNGVASGLKSVNYSIDAEFTAGNIGTYTTPFMLGLGTHTIHYTAGDTAGNQASVKTAYLTVVSSDSTPPVTDFNVAGISANVDGKLYASAGSSVSLDAYDPAPRGTPGVAAYWNFEEGTGDTALDLIGSGSFSVTGSMSTARYTHSAVLLSNGKVLAAGGTNTTGPLSSAELYDPAAGTFAPTGSMTAARQYPEALLLPDGAVLLPNGKVLIAGGASFEMAPGLVSSADLYDPAAGAFSATGSMSAGRYGHTATLLPNGKVLVAGSRHQGTGASLSSAELYDPAAGTFSPTGEMTGAYGGHTATLLPNGRVLLAGGLTPDTIRSSAELYDPAAGAFAATGSMGEARLWHTATLLPDGKVLVAGGYNTTSAELYDPAAGTFSPTGPMSVIRIWHTATLLPNGKVLVTGGSGAAWTPAPLLSAELYDPAAGTFSPAAPMSAERYGHTATLLPNGSVLILGGATSSGDAVSSAEVYKLPEGTANNGDWSGSGPHYGVGQIGSYAGQFNGTDDRLTVPSGDLNPGMGEYTISFWANPQTYHPEGTPLITKWPGYPAGKYFYTWLTDDGHVYDLFADHDNDILDGLYSNSIVPLNAWTHIALTRDAAVGKIYVNGVLDSSRSPLTVDATNTSPLLIGSGAAGDGPNFNGLMDGVGLYKRALRAGEVLQQYQDGLAGKGVTLADSLPSGVALTEYSVDAAPYQVYSAPFSLGEGVRSVEYRSRDNAGNLEVARSTAIYVDGTAPSVNLVVNGSVIADGGTAYIKEHDLIVFTTTDPVINGAASGLARVLYSVDSQFSLETAVPYNEPFELSLGTYTIYYTAIDNVLNQGPVKIVYVEMDTVPPAAVGGLAASADPATGKVTLSWIATGNDGAVGTAAAYDIRYAQQEIPDDTAFAQATMIPNALSPKAAGEPETFTVQNLAGGVYYFAIVAADAAGNRSPVAGAGPVAVPYVAQSSQPAGTAPELIFAATVPVTVASVDIVEPSTTVAIALGRVDEQGLLRASGLYELGPDGTYDPPAVLTFYYSTTTLAELNIAEDEIAVYEYIAGSWVALAGQTLDTTAKKITVPVSTIASLFAIFRASPVTLALEPDTLNLNSNGQYVTAILTAGNLNAACFNRPGVRISAINGVTLADPIFEAASPGNSGGDRGKGVTKDKGNGNGGSGQGGGDSVQCGTMTVKFDRESVIAVLPVNAMVKVTVSGMFADGRDFSADDTIRTIKPKLTSRNDGGRFEHSKRACADAPPLALKTDDELYVVSVEGDLSARESKKESAAKARGVSRRGLAYEFGPDGAVFDKPVTISLPYDTDEKSPEKLIVAYWNEAATAWEPLASRHDAQARVVKAEVGHFSQYQLVAPAPAPGDAGPSASAATSVSVADQGAGVLAVSGTDATFKLGEVYVFPNPAKGAQVPTFHIETGIADSVNIKIYTVSGRAAHEHTLAGLPAEVDDGNGLSYAYEYSWRDHIPSGVYYYYVEAKKGGQKLKKTGKFAVVR